MSGILFKKLTLLRGEELTVMENAYLGISGGKIDYIDIIPPTKQYGEEIDGVGLVAMAGFVNCHTHLPMSSLRGIGENLPLSRWLAEKIYPYEDKMQGEIYYYNTLLGIAEALSFGTTSVTDMYFSMDSIAKAALESGIRANLSRSLVSFGDMAYNLENERVKEAEDAYAKYNGADCGRILINPSLHAEYTNTDSFAEAYYQNSKGKNPSNIHLSETDLEVEECRKRHRNLTPVAYFHKKGILNGAICAHCVAVTDDDIALLAQNNATVVHCPTSNLKLGSGVAPICKMMNSGVNVALGTDGQASHNNLDMFAEMKLSAILQKGINKNPALMDVKETIRMATVNGARAQGRQDTGLLERGYAADIIILCATSPNMTPTHNILNNIVYSVSARDLVYTIVGGKILYDHGKFTTIDIETVREKVLALNNEVLARINN